MPAKTAASENIVCLSHMGHIFVYIIDNVGIEANSVDPDQTAPCRSSLIWVYIVCWRDF